MIDTEKVRNFISFYHKSEQSSLITAARESGYRLNVRENWPVVGQSRHFSQRICVPETLFSEDMPEVFTLEDVQSIAKKLETDFNEVNTILEATLGLPNSTSTECDFWEEIEPFFRQDIIWEGKLNRLYLRQSISGLESMSYIWLEIENKSEI